MRSALAELAMQVSALSAPIHVGVLVPWANTVIEHELPQMAPKKLRWHYARLVPPSRTTALDSAFIDGLVEAIPDAQRQLAKLPLAAVCFGCTSASSAHRDVGTRSDGVRFVSAFDALVDALELLQARRVALLTPYPDDVTAQEADQLASFDLTVVTWHALGLADSYDLVDPDTLTDAFHRLVADTGHAHLDAIVISCTNLPTLDLVPTWERSSGLPVLTSNLAMAISAATAGVAVA